MFGETISRSLIAATFMTSQPITAVVDAESPLFLGIDVGGTSIKIGVVDDQGATLGFSRVDTKPRRPADEAVERTRQAVDGLLADLHVVRSELKWVGLGSPGTMDIPAGMLLEPPNLYAWHQFPLRDAVSNALDLPVAFANDGAAAAYGEFWLGSGRNDASIVMLTLGTGVGGGIIHHNRSIDGEHSHGSECGHVIIDSRPSARVCSCGQTGHLEAYASATAVVKRAQEAIEQGGESSLAERLSEGEPLTALMVSEAAEDGDPMAHELVMETADWLAIGVVSLVHTIDPTKVILGGAMNFGGQDTPLGREFLARIQSQFQAKTFPALARSTQIEFASLGSDAGYLGAAGLARVAYQNSKQ